MMIDKGRKPKNTTMPSVKKPKTPMSGKGGFSTTGKENPLMSESKGFGIKDHYPAKRADSSGRGGGSKS